MAMNSLSKQSRRIPEFLGALLLTCVLTCLPWVDNRSAYADTVVNQVFPLDGVLYDPCTDEFIAFSGVGHTVTTITTNSDGSIHFHTENDLHQAVGFGVTSGREYRCFTNSSYDTNFAAPCPKEFTFTETAHFVSLDSTDDFYMHSTQHATFTACVPTVNVDNSFLDCK